MTNQACCAIRPLDDRVNWPFAFLFFKVHQQKLVGLSQGAAQNNVSQTVIRQMPLTVPSKAIMGVFFDYAQPMLEQIRVLTTQNLKLIKARGLLLPRLMDGRIEV